MTERAVRRALLRAGAAVIALPGLSGGARGADAPRPAVPSGGGALSFTVIGDTPYSPLEAQSLQRVLAQQDDSVDFVFHLGDIKSGWETCSDELITQRHALLAASRRPLIYVPGDNEWTDCSRLVAGSHDPLNRLALLRRLFHAAEGPPSPRFGGFVRQSTLQPMRPFPEHLRWVTEDVVFVSVNLPGSRDGRDDAPALIEARAQRQSATRAWIEQAVATVHDRRARALVIASHANPGFPRDRSGRLPVPADDEQDAYAWWRGLLREVAARVDVPILLLHGDTHSFKLDRPLLDARGQPVRHFTRLECFGTPMASSWARVTVMPGRPTRFFVAIRELERPPGF